MKGEAGGGGKGTEMATQKMTNRLTGLITFLLKCEKCFIFGQSQTSHFRCFGPNRHCIDWQSQPFVVQK